jgi:ABC-type sugar transport system ATPase subunit
MCKTYVDRLSIKRANLKQQVVNLSGGNQQKVVLAKWLSLSPDILILDDPTRGIDVGAKESIYRLISELAENGVSIIFISSELDEVLGICDRILVIAEGKITGDIPRAEANQEKIMSYATIGRENC